MLWLERHLVIVGIVGVSGFQKLASFSGCSISMNGIIHAKFRFETIATWSVSICLNILDQHKVKWKKAATVKFCEAFLLSKYVCCVSKTFDLIMLPMHCSGPVRRFLRSLDGLEKGCGTDLESSLKFTPELET